MEKEYIPYIPGDYGELESEDSIDEEIDDYRYYEVIEGIKVPLHHHVRIVYENGVTQGEGTYLDGYKAGIWRFFNRNGILVSTGSYNEDYMYESYFSKPTGRSWPSDF